MINFLNINEDTKIKNNSYYYKKLIIKMVKRILLYI